MDNAPTHGNGPITTDTTQPPFIQFPASPCSQPWLDEPINPELAARTLSVAAAGLAIGVLSDLLLRATPLGIGLPAWVCAATGVTALTARHAGLSIHRQVLVPLVLAAACACGVAWRDSLFLRSLDIALLVVCAATIALGARSRDLRSCGIADVPLAILQTIRHAVGGTLTLLFREVDWHLLGCARFSREARATLRGLLIALPLILIFGKLFVDADLHFETLVKGLFDFSLRAIALHAVVTALWAWVMTGYLRGVFVARQHDPVEVEPPSSCSLGIIEVCVVMGCLNLLFLSFVIIQFPSLFGGARHVIATAGLTMAQYARRGFFELSTVAALVLPMLLLGHWLLQRESASAQRAFRALSFSLLAMLFIIIASALQRMRLYTASYGLTELRLYVTAFILCLAVVFVWFGLTVLRGHRGHFVAGAFAIGFVSVAVLHAVNPDDLIARTNLAHNQVPLEVDVAYLSNLSADAIPAMVRALPSVSDPRLAGALTVLAARLDQSGNRDWRAWNWGRVRAIHVLGHTESVAHRTDYPTQETLSGGKHG